MPIVLQIRGCGNIVSFKNSKMIARGRLITDPEKQKRMESYTQAIVSQLSSEFQTIGAGISTECSLPSWIASCMPLDDSRHWVPSIGVVSMEVQEGEEGCDIIIQKL